MDNSNKTRDSLLLHKIGPPMEALANLNWLILHDSGDAKKVRFYAELAEKELCELRMILLESGDPSSRRRTEPNPT